MPAPIITTHPSTGPEALGQRAIACLRANRIDPKFLYVTGRQAELWRQVFLRHSPIHGNPEFARIYRDAFTRIVEATAPPRAHVVGLGCGTGTKEVQLCVQLRAQQRSVLFSAIDISRDLVAESSQKLAEAGAEVGAGLACDLGEIAFLAEWIGPIGRGVPRLLTLFGLVPNLAPSLILRLLRAVLRARDICLVSAHLAPVAQGEIAPVAMARVLPQYDNPETLAWLTAGLEELGLENLVGPPEMTIGEIEGVPAFIGQARWKSSRPFEKWGQVFSPDSARPLQVFHSLRYTPELFEDSLKGQGFSVERLAMTACREEAIWAVRLAVPG
jgi:hypothetical protein